MGRRVLSVCDGWKAVTVWTFAGTLAGPVASPVSGQTTLLKPASELTVTVETSGASFRDTDYDAFGLPGVVVLPFKPRLTVVAGTAFTYAVRWVIGIRASVVIPGMFLDSGPHDTAQR
jgi:hypothetical protein